MSNEGQKLRQTCLHDNGDGSFRLTLLVDVRGEDIVDAADLLKRGRALQAAADNAAKPVQMSVKPRDAFVSDPVTCARCGKSGAMTVSRIALTHQAGAGLKPVVTAYCADCAMVEP